ncbi:MAG TPA: hypothetical protein VMQ81_03570 [Acidimicrobiia bacterium]|nr:hypothetical protein [Acidimicrobiia bacterium]
MRALTVEEWARYPRIPDRDRERARLVTVPVLTPGIAGMTLGRWILLRRGHEHDADLVGHELVHVRQWRELGLVRFLWRYLGAYFRGRLRGLGHGDAYAAIPLEQEARALSGH